MEFYTEVAAAFPWRAVCENVVVRFLVQKPFEEQYLVHALAASEREYMRPNEPEEREKETDEGSEDDDDLSQLSSYPPRQVRSVTPCPYRLKSPVRSQNPVHTRVNDIPAPDITMSRGRSPSRPTTVRFQNSQKEGLTEKTLVRGIDKRSKPVILRLQNTEKPPCKGPRWVTTSGWNYAPLTTHQAYEYVEENNLRPEMAWYEASREEREIIPHIPSAADILGMDKVTKPWKETQITPQIVMFTDGSKTESQRFAKWAVLVKILDGRKLDERTGYVQGSAQTAEVVALQEVLAWADSKK